MSKSESHLLASSATKEGIESLIRRFYYLETTDVVEITGAGAVKVNTKICERVAVNKKNGRYRFVMLQE